MLGCCKLADGLCLVMSLYASSAAKRLEVLKGDLLAASPYFSSSVSYVFTRQQA